MIVHDQLDRRSVRIRRIDLLEERDELEAAMALPTAGGAHHVAFTKDGRYAFDQNNLLGLEGMNDGSIMVVDLEQETVVASMNTFKDQGLNPNLIVLLPEWNDPAGH